MFRNELRVSLGRFPFSYLIPQISSCALSAFLRNFNMVDFNSSGPDILSLLDFRWGEAEAVFRLRRGLDEDELEDEDDDEDGVVCELKFGRLIN